jgi:hypothetical protein
MCKLLFFFTSLTIVCISAASAQTYTQKDKTFVSPLGWYVIGYGPPQRFERAIDYEKVLLGTLDTGWIEYDPDLEICMALKSASVDRCSRNVLKTLSMFLAINGKGIFPPTKDTNPYDGFVGGPKHPEQVALLAQAIRVNRSRFFYGDLYAESVSKNWVLQKNKK